MGNNQIKTRFTQQELFNWSTDIGVNPPQLAFGIKEFKSGTGYVRTEHDPLRGYVLADLEDGATSYYGYERADGAWYLQKGVTTGTAISYTYATGTSAYSTAWTARSSQTYAKPSGAW